MQPAASFYGGSVVICDREIPGFGPSNCRSAPRLFARKSPFKASRCVLTDGRTDPRLSAAFSGAFVLLCVMRSRSTIINELVLQDNNVAALPRPKTTTALYHAITYVIRHAWRNAYCSYLSRCLWASGKQEITEFRIFKYKKCMKMNLFFREMKLILDIFSSPPVF